ncbi:MAG: hypothetical protein EXX96DRAFT_555132, partial [Benjaminiella poitrasii]
MDRIRGNVTPKKKEKVIEYRLLVYIHSLESYKEIGFIISFHLYIKIFFSDKEAWFEESFTIFSVLSMSTVVFRCVRKRNFI